MFLPILLLALPVSGQSKQLIDSPCTNSLDVRTEFRSNTDGVGIALQVHAEDDHGKETHLCMTDYSFVIARPDGASTEHSLESTDGSWGRPIKFWIDGFTTQDRLLATIIEQDRRHPSFQIVVYNVRTGKANIFEVPRRFFGTIPSSCGESLRALGTTLVGDPVIGFYPSSACDEPPRAWKLKQGPLTNGVRKPSIPIRLAAPLTFYGIEPPQIFWSR